MHSPLRRVSEQVQPEGSQGGSGTEWAQGGQKCFVRLPDNCRGHFGKAPYQF